MTYVVQLTDPPMTVGPFEEYPPARDWLLASGFSGDVVEMQSPSPKKAFKFLLPVWVTIDDGKVSRVVVDDDAPMVDPIGYVDLMKHPRGWSDEDLKPMTEPVAAEMSAAFASSDWPVWDFGW